MKNLWVWNNGEKVILLSEVAFVDSYENTNRNRVWCVYFKQQPTAFVPLNYVQFNSFMNAYTEFLKNAEHKS